MAASGYNRLHAFLFKHSWLTFLLLGISFLLFGGLSLNLLHTLGANFEFLSMYGVEAVREGALKQLAEVVISGYLAAAAYITSKLCEKVLVERLTAAKPTLTDTETDTEL